MKEFRIDDEMWYDANRCTQRKDWKANICAKCDAVGSIQSERRCQQCTQKMRQQCAKYVRIGVMSYQFDP